LASARATMAKGKKTGGRNFAPGQSGNPSGHPKGFAELRQAAREYTQEALARVVAAMRSEDDRVGLEAAKVILERGWGKPQSAPEDLEALTQQAQVSPELVVRALTRLAGDDDE
jgi:hypothetical protein